MSRLSLTVSRATLALQSEDRASEDGTGAVELVLDVADGLEEAGDARLAQAVFRGALDLMRGDLWEEELAAKLASVYRLVEHREAVLAEVAQ